MFSDYLSVSYNYCLQKVVIGIDIDDSENLDDFYNLRVVFIDEECGNLKVMVESLLETLTKRRSQTFYRLIDLQIVRSPLFCRQGHFFNKQVEYCESVR